MKHIVIVFIRFGMYACECTSLIMALNNCKHLIILLSASKYFLQLFLETIFISTWALHTHIYSLYTSHSATTVHIYFSVCVQFTCVILWNCLCVYVYGHIVIVIIGVKYWSIIMHKQRRGEKKNKKFKIKDTVIKNKVS